MASFQVTTVTPSEAVYRAFDFKTVDEARRFIGSSLQQNTSHGWYTAEKFAATCRPDLFVTDPESGWKYLISENA